MGTFAAMSLACADDPESALATGSSGSAGNASQTQGWGGSAAWSTGNLPPETSTPSGSTAAATGSSGAATGSSGAAEEGADVGGDGPASTGAATTTSTSSTSTASTDGDAVTSDGDDGSDAGADTSSDSTGDACPMECGARECGPLPQCPDVNCGQCPSGDTCVDGRCECVPQCGGRECGPDPRCGLDCGTCANGEICNANAQCECVPACGGRECGPDPVCGEACGQCPAGEACMDGVCETSDCDPGCGTKVCGPSHCPGLVCGECPDGRTCNDGACVCEVDCTDRECGPDINGCGTSCGTCAGDSVCTEGQCVCEPQCDGKTCGPDACGGECGTCADGNSCQDGTCVPDVCTPKCEGGRVCGVDPEDPCDRSCGECSGDQECGPAGVCADPIEPGPTLSVSTHACAIDDGELSCWGRNDRHQLGYEGEGSQNLMPEVVPGSWIAVATGVGFTCAIKSDHSLWCWGANVLGTLGQGTVDDMATATPLAVGDGYAKVSAGESNVCALRRDGVVFCWGSGSTGVLGYCANMSGTSCTLPSASGTPVRIVSTERFVDLDLHASQVIAIREHRHRSDARHAWSWGAFRPHVKARPGFVSGGGNPNGVVGIQAVAGRQLAYVRGPEGLYRVDRIGTVAQLEADAPAGIEDIDAGGYAFCLVDASDDLWCRGNNDVGQIGHGQWVRDGDREALHVSEWTRIHGDPGRWADVSVGVDTVCARDVDGTVWCWGDNEFGTVGDGTQIHASIPHEVGKMAPAATCEDGVASGSETDIDCGGDECPACPTCDDGIQNQDETDVDCGGSTCSATCDVGEGCQVPADCGCVSTSPGVCDEACTDGLCVEYCDDADGDGFGEGNGCSPDCDDSDPEWHRDCDIRDFFGGVPGTKRVAMEFEKDDWECNISWLGSQCGSVWDPPCKTTKEARTRDVDITLTEDHELEIDAVLQEMCSDGYVGGVSDMAGNPTGEAFPTSYPVPMFDRWMYYYPRAIDRCRLGVVTHKVSTSLVNGKIYLDMDCFTDMSYETGRVSDTRRWSFSFDMRAR